jgi:DNA-binding NarL/FixJ family response regulator
MLDGGIQGLEVMLGSGRMNRIVSLAPTAWSEVVADADAFVVEQLETLRPDAASVVPVVDRLAEGRRALVGRETELLELLLTGMSDKRIAAQLELRPNTVRSYNSRIFRKFGVASRSELLALYQSR